MRALTLALVLAAPLGVAAPSAQAFNPFGAYVTGTEITTAQMDAAVIGTTTQAQVSEAFGAPNRREQLGETQVWYYDFTKIKSFGKNVAESTVFEFNKAGVLTAKSKSNGTSGAKTGNPLLDAANGR